MIRVLAEAAKNIKSAAGNRTPENKAKFTVRERKPPLTGGFLSVDKQEESVTVRNRQTSY